MILVFFLFAVVWCQPFCAPSCTNCVNNTVCLSCEAGYWNRHCLRICPDTCGGDGACDRENGHCLSCVDGTYGTKCERRCPAGCAAAADNGTAPLLGGGPCNTTDSQPTCTHGCRTGVYGPSCSSGCLPSCALAPTSRLGGGPCDAQNCTHGCAHGYYGPTCAMTCETCALPFEDQDACDRTTGACLIGCKRGYHGARCQLKCSTGCLGDCDMAGVCAACRPGFCGPMCTPLLGCRAPVCTGQNSTCDECKPGNYGLLCEKQCLSLCNVCDKTTGACIECAPGRYGEACVQFLQGCLVVAMENGRAVCKQCAGEQYWGPTCSSFCTRCDPAPPGTDDNKVLCDIDTGECIHGCASCEAETLAFWIPISIFVILPATIALIYACVIGGFRGRERYALWREAKDKRAKEAANKEAHDKELEAMELPKFSTEE